MERASSTHTLGNALWVTLVGVSLVVLAFTLVPFYMTGGNVPSMDPGWYPDRDYEIASIATYRGTIWEHSEFLKDAFWRVGCYGLFLWLPLLLAAAIVMALDWRSLSGQGRLLRLAVLMCSIVLIVLWLNAIGGMLYITRD